MISPKKLDDIFISLFTGFSENTSIGLDEALLNSISNIFCLNQDKLSEMALKRNSSVLNQEELKELVLIVAQLRQLASIKKQ